MQRTTLLIVAAGLAMCIAGAQAERETSLPENSPRSGVAPLDLDLSGRWVLTLPAGWQRKITITKASEDTYSITGVGGLVCNGVYEIDSAADRLTMLEANDPRQKDFAWRILNANTLELAANGGPNRGSYVGATLSRDFDWDQLTENSRAPRVGERSPRLGR
jgi:hypothetical protein